MIPLAGLLALLFGWGAPGRVPVPSTPLSQSTMRLTLEVPDTVRLGEPVPIRLKLVNPSNHPVDVVLQGRPTAFDVIVSGSTGPVWRRLEREVVAAILQLRRLGPSDSLVLDTEWDQRDRSGVPVSPGEYTVTGELPSDPPAAFRSPPARLRIVP